MYPLLNKDINKIKLQPIIGTVYLKENNEEHLLNVNDSAAAILKLCDGTNSIDTIKKRLMSEYDSDYKCVSEFVDDFISYSESINIIEMISKTNLSEHFDIVGQTEFWSPNIVAIEVTEKCPLYCKHCYLNAGKGIDMDIETLMSLCDQLIEENVDAIQLTGGEVMTYKDIFRVIDYLLENNIDVFISTSGIMYNNDIISRFKNYIGKKVSFQISLEGLEEYHNNFRGSENSFKNAINFIRDLTSMGFVVSVATCILDQPYDEILELCKLLKHLDVSNYRLGTITDRGRAKENNLLVSRKDYDYLEIIKERLQKDVGSESFKISFVEEKMIEENLKFMNNCGLGQSFLAISANGDVKPCILSNIILGNIHGDSIIDIQQKYSNFFSEINLPNHDTCNNCEYELLCKGCIVEALTYCKNTNECNWYISQKYKIDYLLDLSKIKSSELN